MDNLEEKIIELQEQLKKTQAEREETELLVKQQSESSEELQKEEQRLAELMNAVREQKNKIARDNNERHKAVRVKRQIESELNRELQKLLQEKNFQNKLNEFSDSLDIKTAGAPWREWAYNHQITGAKHLAVARRAVLGDKRGLGKTLTSLIYLDMVDAKKTLIFTPKDVSLNFESEVKTWTPNRPVITLTGQNKLMRDTILSAVGTMDSCTIIFNYEAGRKDPSLVERLIDAQFDTVIIDEAHNIKNHQGKDFKMIYKLVYAENKCPTCGSSNFEIDELFGKKCSKCLFSNKNSEEPFEFCSVKNVVPMTGTPILNRPHELWPLLNLVDNVNFGSLYTFLRNYCSQDSDGTWRFDYGGQDRLLKRLGMKYIGRDPKTAGVKMPPQTPQFHVVEFDPKSYPNQWRVMQQIREYGAIKLSEDVALNVPGILAEITRLSQAITFPGGIKMYGKKPDPNDPYKMVPDYKNIIFECDVTESIKIDKAMEIILQAIEEGDRIVLFSRFKEALKEMERRLNDKGITNVRYDGDISDRKARGAQLDFDLKTAPNHSPDEECTDSCPQHDSLVCEGYRYQVFLGQYEKAGTGLNLNAARQMVVLDRYWSPGYEDQASGRIQRLNSTKETVVHIITISSPDPSKNTIDEWMDSLIAAKEELTSGFDNAYAATEFAKAMREGDIF